MMTTHSYFPVEVAIVLDIWVMGLKVLWKEHVVDLRKDI